MIISDLCIRIETGKNTELHLISLENKVPFSTFSGFFSIMQRGCRRQFETAMKSASFHHSTSTMHKWNFLTISVKDSKCHCCINIKMFISDNLFDEVGNH